MYDTAGATALAALLMFKATCPKRRLLAFFGQPPPCGPIEACEGLAALDR